MTASPLPETLPANPLPLIERWLADATAVARVPTAMTLATVSREGRPSARMVICRGFDVEDGWFVFYTDRGSPKAQALAFHARAAVVFYWEMLERQIRIEGPVTDAPDSDSDAYWGTRPLDARVAAIGTDQSRPIASRAALLAKVEAVRLETGNDPPRPSHWGGYRVWAEVVELWVSQPARVHDRAMWTRPLTRNGATFMGGPWRSTRLEP